jgi:diguanylate cyclase (GGDEF)-like protein/PAS domain S-box-containing protein
VAAVTPPSERAAGDARELPELVELLHATSQRIEELTAGEVDAVADRSGRTFLLRHVQDQLRSADAVRQAAIIDALPAHIALLDAQGVILSVNQGWCRFAQANAFAGVDFGVGLDYAAVCDETRGCDAAGAHAVASGVRAILEGTLSTFSRDYVCETPAEVLCFRMTVTPLVDHGPGGAVVMHVDVTDARRSEHHLRDSEMRFRQMADTIRDVFFLRDADGERMHYVSPAYEDIWGRSCASLYANPESWSDAIHPEDRARAQESVAQVGPDPKPPVEYRVVRPDGSIRWIEARSFRVSAPDERIARIAGVAKDITERRRVQDELRESERRFSDMLENVELASVMLDLDARVTYCNDYLLHLSGRTREEVIGSDWFTTFMPPEFGNMRPVFAALLDGDATARHREHEIVTRSGERRLIRWNNSQLRSGSGEVIGSASIGEDITERREAMQRLAHLNRVHSVLSGINALIARARKRDELLQEACRVAHDMGGFRMAMICIVDEKTGRATPVGSAGVDDELMQSVRALLDPADPGKGGSTMIERALHERHPVVSNDTQGDDRVLLANAYLERGVRSLAVLPLLIGDEAIGVLALYATERGFFHSDEMALLTELANDIAYAIDHVQKQARLDYLAYYDDVTGLANRRLFLERVGLYLRSAGNAGQRMAVGLIDLERFKDINDGLGHAAGDALLGQVARWLTQNMGDANLVARVGSDHFAIVIPSLASITDLQGLFDRRMEAMFNHPFHLNGTVLRVAFKMGVSLFPDDGSSADALFKNAEAALKQAKQRGDRLLFYTQQMTAAVAGRLTLDNQLRQALDNDEFVLHYQPKINLLSGELTGAEALIRWNDPRTGLVPPGRFIPVLEQTGLIYEVGRWALRKAVADYLRWINTGLRAVRVAVNVSPLQLRHRSFIDEIRTVIGVDDRARSGLELELTESLIMEDVKHSIASLHAIRSMDVTIAIDDFGTGFSSLSYLARLPVDTLKIDRSFVVDMTGGPQGLALVSTVINLAHALKLNVVAEGVETDEQSRLLRLIGCDEMQGFLFSKALPCEEFEATFLSPVVESHLRQDDDPDVAS